MTDKQPRLAWAGKVAGKALFALVCGTGLAQTACAQGEVPVLEGHEEGQKLYMANCAKCHGQDLQGANAQSLVDGIYQFGADGGSVFRNIKYGIATVGMPDYGPTLNDEQIRSIIGFMNAAGDSLGVKRPPLPELIQARDYDINVEVVVGDEGKLQIPWAMTFIDNDTALVTERPGRLRFWRDGKMDEQAIAGLPKIERAGQGGLMDVAIDPDYADNGYVYLSFSHALDNGNAMTKVVRARIENNKWVGEETVYEAPHDTYINTRHHYGSRLAFGPDKTLYISIGDRGHGRDAQNLSKPNGKVHRVNRDGSVPSDNPFVDKEGALPTIYSYGHRNPQGMATHPVTGQIWEAEHGPMGGDEVNLIGKANNYGWETITYGLNYNGTVISEDVTREGMEDPVHYWVPSIAVCGIDFYGEGPFARWENNLIVGGLGHEVLSRLVTAGDRVIYEEVLLKGHGRVRDVAVSPDGAIYVVQNGPDRIIKLTMKNRALRQ